MQKTLLTIRIDEPDRERLEQLACADERTVGHLVRVAIRRYLREIEQQRQALPAGPNAQAPLAV